MFLTWVALALDVDMKVAAFFFNKSTGWIYKDAEPWKAFYLFGTMPGLALALTSLCIIFLGFIQPKWQAYQRQMLVIVLTTILGAGVLVNAILKPYCGRPRPREIVTFNGQWEFSSPCFNDAPKKGLSFPCGHCTMAFIFVTLIYLRPKAPVIAYGGALFGLIYGILMGVARAAQGAHFVTDTLWSLGVLVVVSLLCNYILIPVMAKSWLRARTFSSKQLAAIGIGFTVLMGGITLSFLTRRPYHEVTTRELKLPPSINQVIVHVNVDLVKKTIDYKNAPVVAGLLSEGFGWANADERIEMIPDPKGKVFNLKIRAISEGYFAELQHEFFLTLPVNFKHRVHVKVETNTETSSN